MEGAGRLATLIKIYTDKMKHAADHNESHKLRYELGDKVGQRMFRKKLLPTFRKILSRKHGCMLMNGLGRR